MLAWLLLAPLAAAAPAGHYHPVDVGLASAQFRRAQAVAGAAFEDRQARAQDVAHALNAFEEALDLLGERAPEDQRARQAALAKAFGREHAVLQAFAQTKLDELDAAFSAALDRALKGRELEVCEDPKDTGPRIGGGFARSAPKACTGPSLSAELAATMDKDPALKASIDRILADAWPAVTVEAVPVAAVGTGTGAVDVDALLRRGAGHALAAIDDADAEAREPFEAALEQGASEAELTALVAKAKAVTADTATRRAAVAEPVLRAIEAEAAKAAKKGGPTVAWCAQPELLGGCSTAPLAKEALDGLLARPKVAGALEQADASRP